MGGIILFSDPHFGNRTSFGRYESNPEFPGCNSRFHVIARAFRAAVEYALENNCESIFILGDVFHERGVIEVPVYNGVYQLFREATGQGIRIVVYPGNHDMQDLRAMHVDKHLHSLFAFEKLANVYDKPSIVQTAYFPVAIIPYSSGARGVVETSERLLNKMSGDIRMLMLHHSVDGAKTGPHEWVMPNKLDVDAFPEGYSHIWSGHYHQHQMLTSTDRKKRLWYVGAPAHHDFGERNYVPGFIHIHSDGKWQHIENTSSPRFKVYTTNDIDKIKDMINPNDYNSVRWQGDVADLEYVKKQLPYNCDVEAENISPSSGVLKTRASIDTTDPAETMIEKYANTTSKMTDPSEIIEHGKFLYKGHK